MLEVEKAELMEEKKQIQQENEHLRSELASKTQKQEENDRVIAEQKRTIQQTKTEVTRIEEFIISSNIIVAFSPQHFRVMFGVLDAAEFPQYFITHAHSSPKAAMMYNSDGCLISAGRSIAQNTKPESGQEWSAEADLEKKTLHFFVNRVQQSHHFINIPIPLVFAIDDWDRNVPIKITYWGETQSHVTNEAFEGDSGKRLAGSIRREVVHITLFSIDIPSFLHNHPFHQQTTTLIQVIQITKLQRRGDDLTISFIEASTAQHSSVHCRKTQHQSRRGVRPIRRMSGNASKGSCSSCGDVEAEATVTGTANDVQR
ncbi:hypothetical protein BLNAU_12549 [Blattamonas nauphoetae]|uniref:Uncharacterized protein n=1 Tax=Blattamonas nauphoetae TaxID=2049346 RepID=A0ABQ9XMA2_9EUKA|nr:hypothetical protein BLNAU_12549 [Blattamonas nauphoetae]